MQDLPFSVLNRSGRKYFYVAFKSETDGSYLPSISTKQTTKADAVRIAWEWHSKGVPNPANRKSIEQSSIVHAMKKAVISTDEARAIIDELKKRGLIKSAIMAGSKGDRDFVEFLLEFWDFDRSPYVKEKLRKNHGIHRNYVLEQFHIVKRYWQNSFSGRLLGEITREDLEAFINSLEARELSFSRKNLIIKAGTIALKWCFAKGLIENDITSGITLFSGKTPKRQILSPDMVQKLFAAEWTDKRAKLASMLSCVTGLRSGEVRGLHLADIGQDCLYVRHSWNSIDKLKTTKNNEERIVQLPFPFIIQGLLELGKSNPHNLGNDGFIFYSTLPDKPLERKSLMSAGI
jgi:hypothetical protein